MSKELLVLLVCTLGGAAACVDAFEPEVGELNADACQNEDTNPAVEVSFSMQVLPKLQGGCGCHNPLSGGSRVESTGFSVATLGTIVQGGNDSRGKSVIPGDPCGSYLFHKLTDAPPSGSRMPPNGPYWSRQDLNLLHDWIAEGARAN